MPSQTLLVFVSLCLIASAFAGCNTAQGAACQTDYDSCIRFNGNPLQFPPCECSQTYKTCMIAAACCATSSATDACADRCAANCGNGNTACTWPPAVLDDNCANRDTCVAVNTQGCTGANCGCEISLRQCLLFNGCSYSTDYSSACTSDCSTRTPAATCTAQAATAIAPSAPAGCTPQPGYVRSGDCSCQDPVVTVISTATCATGTWTVAGPYTLAGLIVLETDVLRVNGDLTIAAAGDVSVTPDWAAPSQGKLVVTGALNVQGKILGQPLNPELNVSRTLEIATFASLTIAPTNYLVPAPPTGTCFSARSYETTATSIAIKYTLAAGQTPCPSLNNNTATPPPPPTTTSTIRPSPPAVQTPANSASGLLVAAAAVLFAVALLF